MAKMFLFSEMGGSIDKFGVPDNLARLIKNYFLERYL